MAHEVEIGNFPKGDTPQQSAFFDQSHKDPYKTKTAKAAQDAARSRLPKVYAQKSMDALSAATGGAHKVNLHNALTLGYGLAYANAGLHVCDAHALDKYGKGTGPGGQSKVPRGACWQDRATTDLNAIAAFWGGKGEYPEDNKGNIYPFARPDVMRNVSVTFPDGCGLFVLDIDGEEGLAALEALEAEYGELPQTWESITGSGGVHLIFRAEGLDIRNTASSIAPGVDIRGKNGQIIAPPSIHPSGNFYEWEEGCAPWELEVAEAPEWLRKLAFEATKGRADDKPKVKPKKRKASSNRASSAETCKSDARGLDAHLSEIGDGDGLRGFDGPIYSAACAYFAREGSDADAEPIKDTLREATLAAPCKDDRAEIRYATDDYLDTRVEQAREFIAENPAERAQAEHKWVKPPFDESNGLFVKMGADDNPDRPLCQAFDVVGRSSNLAGDAGAGRIIRFINENGVDVEMTLDRSALFKADGGGVLDALADAGMDLRFSGKIGRSDMLDLLRTIKSDRQVPVSPHPGWTRDRAGHVTGFLCPTGEFIAVSADAPDMRLHSSATTKDRLPSGNLDGWKASAKESKNNFHWTLGLCAGFAGPVLDLIGGLPCGVNLSGDSSLGKTIALMLGTTVWTSAVSGKGNFHVMNSTPNALEDLFTMGSGTITALDEIGALQNAAALGAMLFGASSGSGKSRKAGRGVGLAETAEFCTVTLLTNEHGLKDTITGAGGTYKTGLSVRFPDVDVTAVKKVSADVLAKLDMAKENFGHAGPEFIRYLISEGWHTKPEELKKRVKDTAAKIAGKDAAPALRRAAQVFALFQVAGELAAEVGLIEKKPIKAAVKTAFNVFRQSDEGRATTGGDSLLDGLRSWVVRNIGRTLVNAEEAADPSYREARGWVTATHVILDYELLADMKGMGLSGKRDTLLDALDKAGALERSGKNRMHNKLPAAVKLDGGATEKRAANVRIKRDVLGV